MSQLDDVRDFRHVHARATDSRSQRKRGEFLHRWGKWSLPRMGRKAADILLVEDDNIEVELTLHALRKHCAACLVDVARDGEEAIDYLSYRGAYARRESAQPRLVVLDINLPKKSGIEVLAAIKGDARMQLIPVVMLTSSRDAEDVSESYRRGANGYVVKPLDFGMFDQVMGSVCRYWLFLNSVPRLTEPLGSGLASWRAS